MKQRAAGVIQQQESNTVGRRFNRQMAQNGLQQI